MAGSELFPDDQRAPRRLSLVRLSAEIARALAPVGRVSVEGEVHRPTRGGGGRIWFTLRDRAAQISVTCPANRASKCRAVAGERVCVTGALQYSNDQGRLLLVAEEVMPVGAGAVAAHIADVRARLRLDGLLDRPRRRIPRLPVGVGVVCGTEAAVRADIESVIDARFPGFPVEFAEVAVSGPGASESVVAALRRFDARVDIDVIVLARGGGDAPQLLPFSDEDLCRAICAASTPVVSAIGHHGDRPLCDEVADLRCGTPSIAAAAVVPDRTELENDLARLIGAADGALVHRLESSRRRLAAVDRVGALTSGLAVAHARLDRAASRLELLHPRGRLARCREQLEGGRRQMEALSPTRVLERGYAVVRDERGAVVRSASGLALGARLQLQLARGEVDTRVEETRP